MRTIRRRSFSTTREATCEFTLDDPRPARAPSIRAALGTGFLLVMVTSPIRAEDVLPSPRYDAASNTWIRPKLVEPLATGSHQGELSGEGEGTFNFDSSVRVHPAESGQHLWPDIAARPDGLIATAWMDDHAAGGYHIFYSTSTNGGVTWSTPEKVDTRASGSYSKFVDLEFTPSGIPVVVWEDDRLGPMNVFLSKRDPANGGTPWTTNVKVNTVGSPPDGTYFMNPSMAVLSDDRYFVAWTDWREGVFYQVYCRSTTDGGATWGTETRVSDEIGFQPVAGDPCLIGDPASLPGSERLYCVTNDWRGMASGGRYPNVYFYRSTNGGATWTNGVRANDIEPLYQQVSSHALVRMNDGALVAGWMNDNTLSGSHFRTCRSTNEGATWQPSVQVDQAASSTDVYNSIATDDLRIFAAFGVYDGSWDIYFSVSDDGGMTWSEEMMRVDDDVTSAAAGNAVVTPMVGLNVHVVWQDNRFSPFNWKIYAARGFAVGVGVHEFDRVGTGIVARPNPFRMTETVEVASSGEGEGFDRVTIHDASGRLVRELSSSEGGLMWTRASWDGNDGGGRALPPGVYWARVVSLRGEANQRAVPLVRLR